MSAARCTTSKARSRTGRLRFVASRFIPAWIMGAGPALTVGILAVSYAACLKLMAPDLFADAVRLAYAKKQFKSSDES